MIWESWSRRAMQSNIASKSPMNAPGNSYTSKESSRWKENCLRKQSDNLQQATLSRKSQTSISADAYAISVYLRSQGRKSPLTFRSHLKISRSLLSLKMTNRRSQNGWQRYCFSTKLMKKFVNPLKRSQKKSWWRTMNLFRSKSA